MTKYTLEIHGQDAEKFMRIMDKLFRAYYNVYGGKREMSKADRQEGLVIIMSYEAQWDGEYWCSFESILNAAVEAGIRARLWWDSRDESAGGLWYKLKAEA